MSVTNTSFTRLTIPIFIQMALLLVIFLTDTFFLSTISDQAVAGVGSAIPVLLTSIALMHAISDPGISLLGQQLGSNNLSRLSSTFLVMLAACGVLAIALTVITVLIALPFGSWIGLGDVASKASYTYLFYIAPIFILDILFINFNSMIFAQGRTQWTMYAAVSSAATNILLNTVLYLELIPGWSFGVREVALATLAAQIPPILIMGYCIFKVIGFKFNLQQISREDMAWSRRRIMSISLPATIEPVSYNTSQLVVYSMLAGVAVSAVAGYTYGKNILLLFSYAAAIAVGIGTQVVVSHYQGMNNYDAAVNRMTRSLSKFLPLVFIVAMVIYFAAEPILSIFTQDPEIISMTKIILMFMLIIETAKAGNYVIFPALRGSGDVNVPVASSLVTHWVFCVGLGYYLAVHMNYGVYGVLIGVAADEVLRFLVNSLRWYKRYWERTLQLSVSAETT